MNILKRGLDINHYPHFILTMSKPKLKVHGMNNLQLYHCVFTNAFDVLYSSCLFSNDTEPIKEPLSTMIVVAIVSAAVAAGIIILVTLYLMCCGCHNNDNKSHGDEDDKQNTRVSMTNTGYVSDGADDKHRQV